MSGINPYSSSIGNSSSWNPNPASTSTLTEDQADALYFECRDTGYFHEKAVAYVRENGGSSGWVEPHATDYQGLPDVPQASNSNAGRVGFDRMVATQQSSQQKPINGVPGLYFTPATRNYDSSGSVHSTTDRWIVKSKRADGTKTYPTFSKTTYKTIEKARVAAVDEVRKLVNSGGGTKAQKTYFANEQ